VLSVTDTNVIALFPNTQQTQHPTEATSALYDRLRVLEARYKRHSDGLASTEEEIRTLHILLRQAQVAEWGATFDSIVRSEGCQYLVVEIEPRGDRIRPWICGRLIRSNGTVSPIVSCLYSNWESVHAYVSSPED
jgi:hypothetical protein